MTRIRVATVVTRLQAGAGVVALRGALALPSSEFDVSIVAGRGDHSADRLVALATDAGVEVIAEPTLCSPISPTDDLRALRRLTELFRQRGFDVVHTHSAKAGALGRLAAHRVGTPRIVHTFHGFPFHEFQSSARRAGYVGLERRLGRYTDIGFCVGSGVAVEAIRRGLIAPERVHTIGVPVDLRAPVATSRARAAARRALGVAEDAVLVGVVGRLSYQKAPEDFVAAMTALRRPEVTGIWIGGGELADQVGALAARALPGARVLLAGERANVPDLLPALDLFVLPSRYEGLPVAIVEAMVCGIPVVATAVNAVPDLVVPGQTGLLVPPQRPDLLATAIGYLLDRPAEAARMAMAAKALIGHRYHRDALAAELAAAYTEPATPQLDREPSCA